MGQAEIFGQFSDIFEEAIVALPGDHEDVGVEVGQNDPEHFQFAGDLQMGCPVLSVGAAEEGLEVEAEEVHQSGAAGELMLIVHNQAAVHLPVLLLEGQVLLVLEGLQLHEGRVNRLLKRQVGQFHERVDQHQAGLVFFCGHDFQRLEVSWL